MTKRIIVHGVPNESAGTIRISRTCVATTLTVGTASNCIGGVHVLRMTRWGHDHGVFQLMWQFRVDPVIPKLGDYEEMSGRCEGNEMMSTLTVGGLT